MNTNRRCVVIPLLCLGLVLGATAHGERKAIYKPGADARADIASAVEKAGKENKRVLIQWGANWCGWCHLLHEFFEEDAEAKALLASSYVVVLVDTDTNKALLEEMAVEPQGIPYLTILDGTGKKLVDQETGALETGSRHDPKKVNPFLKKWQPAAAEDSAEDSAEEQVAAALKAAVKEGKGVFVSIGADWCGWCRRLDALLANEVVGPILRERFILLKLDQDKVAGTKEFRAGHGSELSGGIPWYAALDATGQVVATSDAKAGNTGYPAKPEEIDWFMDVIKRSAPGMDPAKVATLEAEVRRIGQELLPN